MHKILYVEDNKDTAIAVKTILESEGYNVEFPLTGKEGIVKLEKKNFDLVILDIMLPDINGIEVFGEAVKKRKNCKYAILSIITVPGGKLKELKKKGMTECINKPFRKNDLLVKIKKILE